MLHSRVKTPSPSSFSICVKLLISGVGTSLYTCLEIDFGINREIRTQPMWLEVTRPYASQVEQQPAAATAAAAEAAAAGAVSNVRL